MIDPTTNMLAGPPTSQSPGGAMTLEMAIRDWQQRLDKQAAEIERLREDAMDTKMLDFLDAHPKLVVRSGKQAIRPLILAAMHEQGEG